MAKTKASEPSTYSCPLCGAISHNPSDKENRYCGVCHQFADDVLEMLELAIRLAKKRGSNLISIPISLAAVTVDGIRSRMGTN